MVAEAPTATVTNAEAQQKFQKLKTHLHRRMIDAIDLSKAGQIEESELRQQLRSLASHLVSMDEVKLPVDQRDHMVREIMDEIYGFGPLEPLMNDPEVSDVLVNGPDRVFVERDSAADECSVCGQRSPAAIDPSTRRSSRSTNRRSSADGRCQIAGRFATERRDSAAGLERADGFYSSFPFASVAL